jgi:hypothetical protein
MTRVYKNIFKSGKGRARRVANLQKTKIKPFHVEHVRSDVSVVVTPRAPFGVHHAPSNPPRPARPRGHRHWRVTGYWARDVPGSGTRGMRRCGRRQVRHRAGHAAWHHLHRGQGAAWGLGFRGEQGISCGLWGVGP